MALTLVTAPATEPVALVDVKNDMRVDVDFTDHDALITSLIQAGRQHAENICRRAFVTQTWRLVVDRFPSPMSGRLTEFWLGQSWGMAGMGGVSSFSLTDRTGFGFQLPFPPLASVDSIKYIDPAGVQQTLSAATYKVDQASEPARVLPAFGKSWPSTRQEINAVELTFTVGYGAAAAVPSGIKAAIVMYCKAHYEPTFDDGQAVEYERRMKAIDHILTPYRVFTLL